MNRREFLRLTVKGHERVLELSCERLYVQWLDAQTARRRGDASGVADLGLPEWEGEPPLEVRAATAEQLFAELERRLSEVQVLRVVGREWLTGDDFRREVEARIEAFRRRGGRVE